MIKASASKSSSVHGSPSRVLSRCSTAVICSSRARRSRCNQVARRPIRWRTLTTNPRAPGLPTTQLQYRHIGSSNCCADSRSGEGWYVYQKLEILFASWPLAGPLREVCKPPSHVNKVAACPRTLGHGLYLPPLDVLARTSCCGFSRRV